MGKDTSKELQKFEVNVWKNVPKIYGDLHQGGSVI